MINKFYDNNVKGWEKFDFGTVNGYFKEKDAQFAIGMHKPTGQPFFDAATHKAEKFTVTDGVTVEFLVDLIEANQSNAFAVLSFIPSDTPVSKLSGYSVVKDDTNILLAKGLNKYFYDLTEGDWLDVTDNITLTLTLTGRGKSVEVTTRVFDIENGNALISVNRYRHHRGGESRYGVMTVRRPASSTSPASSFCFCTITILEDRCPPLP